MKTSVNNRNSDFMPHDINAQKILSDRARILAEPPQKQATFQERVDYVEVKLLGNQFYGVPYQYVTEVLRTNNVTKIPLLPNFVFGVTNWRGKLLTVIDLKALFQIQNESKEQAEYIIVINNDDFTIGILVDDIVGDGVYDANKITPSLSVSGKITAGYILGLHDGKKAILSVDNILKDIQLQLDKQLS